MARLVIKTRILNREEQRRRTMQIFIETQNTLNSSSSHKEDLKEKFFKWFKSTSADLEYLEICKSETFESLKYSRFVRIVVTAVLILSLLENCKSQNVAFLTLGFGLYGLLYIMNIVSAAEVYYKIVSDKYIRNLNHIEAINFMLLKFAQRFNVIKRNFHLDLDFSNFNVNRRYTEQQSDPFKKTISPFSLYNFHAIPLGVTIFALFYYLQIEIFIYLESFVFYFAVIIALLKDVKIDKSVKQTRERHENIASMTKDFKLLLERKYFELKSARDDLNIIFYDVHSLFHLARYNLLEEERDLNFAIFVVLCEPIMNLNLSIDKLEKILLFLLYGKFYESEEFSSSCDTNTITNQTFDSSSSEQLRQTEIPLLQNKTFQECENEAKSKLISEKISLISPEITGDDIVRQGDDKINSGNYYINRNRRPLSGLTVVQNNSATNCSPNRKNDSDFSFDKNLKIRKGLEVKFKTVCKDNLSNTDHIFENENSSTSYKESYRDMTCSDYDVSIAESRGNENTTVNLEGKLEIKNQEECLSEYRIDSVTNVNANCSTLECQHVEYPCNTDGSGYYTENTETHLTELIEENSESKQQKVEVYRISDSLENRQSPNRHHEIESCESCTDIGEHVANAAALSSTLQEKYVKIHRVLFTNETGNTTFNTDKSGSINFENVTEWNKTDCNVHCKDKNGYSTVDNEEILTNAKNYNKEKNCKSKSVASVEVTEESASSVDSSGSVNDENLKNITDPNMHGKNSSEDSILSIKVKSADAKSVNSESASLKNKADQNICGTEDKDSSHNAREQAKTEIKYISVDALSEAIKNLRLTHNIKDKNITKTAISVKDDKYASAVDKASSINSKTASKTDLTMSNDETSNKISVDFVEKLSTENNFNGVKHCEIEMNSVTSVEKMDKPASSTAGTNSTNAGSSAENFMTQASMDGKNGFSDDVRDKVTTQTDLNEMKVNAMNPETFAKEKRNPFATTDSRSTNLECTGVRDETFENILDKVHNNFTSDYERENLDLKMSYNKILPPTLNNVKILKSPLEGNTNSSIYSKITQDILIGDKTCENKDRNAKTELNEQHYEADCLSGVDSVLNHVSSDSADLPCRLSPNEDRNPKRGDTQCIFDENYTETTDANTLCMETEIPNRREKYEYDESYATGTFLDDKNVDHVDITDTDNVLSKDESHFKSSCNFEDIMRSTGLEITSLKEFTGCKDFPHIPDTYYDDSENRCENINVDSLEDIYTGQKLYSKDSCKPGEMMNSIGFETQNWSVFTEDEDFPHMSETNYYYDENGERINYNISENPSPEEISHFQSWSENIETTSESNSDIDHSDYSDIDHSDYSDIEYNLDTEQNMCSETPKIGHTDEPNGYERTISRGKCSGNLLLNHLRRIIKGRRYMHRSQNMTEGSKVGESDENVKIVFGNKFSNSSVLTSQRRTITARRKLHRGGMKHVIPMSKIKTPSLQDISSERKCEELSETSTSNEDHVSSVNATKVSLAEQRPINSTNDLISSTHPSSLNEKGLFSSENEAKVSLSKQCPIEAREDLVSPTHPSSSNESDQFSLVNEAKVSFSKQYPVNATEDIVSPTHPSSSNERDHLSLVNEAEVSLSKQYPIKVTEDLVSPTHPSSSNESDQFSLVNEARVSFSEQYPINATEDIVSPTHPSSSNERDHFSLVNEAEVSLSKQYPIKATEDLVSPTHPSSSNESNQFSLVNEAKVSVSKQYPTNATEDLVSPTHLSSSNESDQFSLVNEAKVSLSKQYPTNAAEDLVSPTHPSLSNKKDQFVSVNEAKESLAMQCLINATDDSMSFKDLSPSEDPSCSYSETVLNRSNTNSQVVAKNNDKEKLLCTGKYHNYPCQKTHSPKKRLNLISESEDEFGETVKIQHSSKTVHVVCYLSAYRKSKLCKVYDREKNITRASVKTMKDFNKGQVEKPYLRNETGAREELSQDEVQYLSSSCVGTSEDQNFHFHASTSPDDSEPWSIPETTSQCTDNNNSESELLEKTSMFNDMEKNITNHCDPYYQTFSNDVSKYGNSSTTSCETSKENPVAISSDSQTSFPDESKKTTWNSDLCMADMTNVNQHAYPTTKCQTDEQESYYLNNSVDRDEPIKYSLRYENLDLNFIDTASCITLRLESDKDHKDSLPPDWINRSGTSSTPIFKSDDDAVLLPLVESSQCSSDTPFVNISENDLTMCAETNKSVNSNSSSGAEENALDTFGDLQFHSTNRSSADNGIDTNALRNNPDISEFELGKYHKCATEILKSIDTFSMSNDSDAYGVDQTGGKENEQNYMAVVNPEDKDFHFETENLKLNYKPNPASGSIQVSFRKRQGTTKLVFKSEEKKLYIKTAPL